MRLATDLARLPARPSEQNGAALPSPFIRNYVVPLCAKTFLAESGAFGSIHPPTPPQLQ
jgi:hypothetical protein